MRCQRWEDAHRVCTARKALDTQCLPGKPVRHVCMVQMCHVCVQPCGMQIALGIACVWGAGGRVCPGCPATLAHVIQGLLPYVSAAGPLTGMAAWAASPVCSTACTDASARRATGSCSSRMSAASAAAAVVRTGGVTLAVTAAAQNSATKRRADGAGSTCAGKAHAVLASKGEGRDTRAVGAA